MKKWSKETFAKNLTRYIEASGKTQKDIADYVGVSAPTMSDWANGKIFPRIDKIEMLANYFGCLKSDLIEDKTEMRENSEALTDIVIKLRNNPEFFRVVNKLKGFNDTKLQKVDQLLGLLDTFTE
mgnify:CR=1 FL=1